MRYFHKAIAAIWPATVTATLLGLSFARPAHAVPVIIESEGLPGIDVAQRDSAGRLRLFDAVDDDNDGIISFVADLDPTVSAMYRRFNQACNVAYFDGHAKFIPDASVPVIMVWNSPPTLPFMLGQFFSVVDGQIAGLDAVVYVSPGGSIVDLVDLDLTTLPLYTGSAQVGGLVRFQVVPEPSTLGLALAGVVIIAVVRRSRIRV